MINTSNCYRHADVTDCLT